MPRKQRIIIIAGPNGAGKTTFAREYLLQEAHCPDFINVDLIAAGLSPFNPDRAAILRLIFLDLPDPEMALSRVKMRVAQGGHNVSNTVIQRRFDAGLHNFENVYKHLVDKWEWYDNAGNTPQLISEAGNWR